MNIFENSIVLLDGVISESNLGEIQSAPSNTSSPSENVAGTTETGTGTAQPAPPSEPSGLPLPAILLYAAMFAAMYFFLIRPQRKQAKAMKELQETLAIGENIITSNGMYGKIVGIGEDSFLIEFGENRGVRIWVRKSDVIGIKTPIITPLSADSIEDKKSK